jgi:hypothetical protein
MLPLLTSVWGEVLEANRTRPEPFRLCELFKYQLLIVSPSHFQVVAQILRNLWWLGYLLATALEIILYKYNEMPGMTLSRDRIHDRRWDQGILEKRVTFKFGHARLIENFLRVDVNFPALQEASVRNLTQEEVFWIHTIRLFSRQVPAPGGTYFYVGVTLSKLISTTKNNLCGLRDNFSLRRPPEVNFV